MLPISGMISSSLKATVGDNLSDCEPVVGITNVFYLSGTLYTLPDRATQSQNQVEVCLSYPHEEVKWSDSVVSTL